MKSPLVSRISQQPILFGSNLYDWNLIWVIATFEDLFQQGVYASLAGIFGVPKYEKIVIQVYIYILHMNITNIYIYILQVCIYIYITYIYIYYKYIYIYVLHVCIYIYYIWILTMFDLLLFLPANPYVVGSWDLQTWFFYRHQHCLHLCLPYHMVCIYIYSTIQIEIKIKM